MRETTAGDPAKSESPPLLLTGHRKISAPLDCPIHLLDSHKRREREAHETGAVGRDGDGCSSSIVGQIHDPDHIVLAEYKIVRLDFAAGRLDELRCSRSET